MIKKDSEPATLAIREGAESNADNDPGWLIKKSADYEKLFPLRAAIQAIPVMGGTIDTMLAGLGARWQAKRLEDFVQKLSSRLSEVEAAQSASVLAPSEPLYDFVRQVFEHVVKTRSEEKRLRFANVVAHQIRTLASWDDAEEAARILSDLSEFDLAVLTTVTQALPCGEPFAGMRLAIFIPPPERVAMTPPPLDLPSAFPAAPHRALLLSVSRLISLGLLRDEGIGRWGTKPLNYVVASGLGEWFMRWISDEHVTAAN